MKLVWTLGLVACSASAPSKPAPSEPAPAEPVAKAPPEPAPAKPTPPSPPAPPACVKDPASSVYEWKLAGNDLRACFVEGDVVDCWTYGLAANTWAHESRHPFVDPPAAPVTAAGSTITACKEDHSDCRSIPLSPPLVGDQVADVSANADRSLVALQIDGGPIRVLDASGKQRAVIKGWPTSMSGKRQPAAFRKTRFLGTRLAAFIADTPVTSAIRLFDPMTGKKIGDVNAGKPMSDNDPVVDLGANQFAFVEFDTSVIIVHDVITGRRVRTYKVPGVEPAGYAMMVLAPDGKTLLASQGATIYRVNLASGEVGRSAAPTCP